MQGIIILSLVALCLLDRWVDGGAPPDLTWRIAALPAALLIGPMMIGWRFAWSPRWLRDWQEDERKSQWLAAGTWFASGLFLVGVLKWGSLVRAELGLARLAPLDGLVWFMPLVASLLLCWWGLFAAQRRSGNQTGRWSRQDICEALEFVGIRAAVYLIPTLVPLAMVMAAQALARSPWVRGAPWGASAIYGGVLICFLACMPWVLAVSWRTRRLPPSPLRLALENLTPGDRPFRDVRIWPTGHQMTNALVIGAIPRLRLLVLTDRLVRLMDASELVAVVRHELGHIRRHHLTTRLLFLLLPIAASSSFVLIGSTEFGADSRVGELDLARTSEVWVAIGAVYAIYAFAALGWLSRAMEHDADLFACRADLKRGSRLSPDATQEYCGALTKLCADSGGDSGRSDWLHPSLRNRIDLLQSCLADGSRVASFEREFARRKWTLAAIAIGGGALAAWL